MKEPDLFADLQKVFLVTGAIKSSADIKSDSKRRLAQTIESIQAIRSIRPEARISYLDSSGVSLVALEEAFGDHTSIKFHQILDSPNIQRALSALSDSTGFVGSGLHKSLLEVATYRTYFREFADKESLLAVTKVSGRYVVQRNFSLDQFVTDAPRARVLKSRHSYLRPKNSEFQRFTRTVAWSIFGKSSDWLDGMFQEVETLLTKSVVDRENLDLEHAFLKVLLSSGIETNFESKLRVSGEVASTGRKIWL